jgi:secreted Zn-dependent insulinase-like peptidase
LTSSHDVKERYRFQEEQDATETVTQLASEMRVFSPQHILVGSYLYGKWDASLIQQLMSLMSPDSKGMRIDLQSSEYNAICERVPGTFEVRRF